MLSQDHILLQTSATTKLEVIQALTTLAYELGKVNDVESFVAAVLEREAQYSTGVGYHIAIPHGKSVAVNEPVLLIAQVNDIEWDSLDGLPVKTVFLIGVPLASEGEVHLRILAQLSRNLMKAPFREQLFNARSKEDIMHLFATLAL